jgi:NLR family CARD domain-containing protein 3
MQSTTRLPKTESWTAAGFIGTLGIPELLAAQLVEVGCPNELGALQSLVCQPDLKQELRRRLTSGIDVLIGRLSSALENLASDAAPTAEQLQAKFMQDGAGLLAYGDLNTFFGGLEAVVGAPLPRVRETMATEHTQQPDSRLEFTTKNYVVTTTSETEWKFVAEPSSRPHDAWPVEAKLVLARKPGGSKSARLGERIAIVANEHQKRRRAPMPIAELERHVEEQSARLLEQREPALTLEEAFGARLYSGPLYYKYNAVLRGLSAARLDSPVLDLRCKMVRLCCSDEDAASHAKAADEAKAKRLAEEPLFGKRKPTAADEKALREYTHGAYEAVEQRINKYTTTLHAINSAIVKLSKLTKASTVYRGVHDVVLPDQFWTPNKYGVRGGIDSGFLSTTLVRKEAMENAADGKTAPLLFEIQQGMIDRGADISFLSQYRFEEEILFNPLTGLEVRGEPRVEGKVLIVEVKLSINLTSLTIEQVIGKRKKVLQDMVPGLEAEVRQALRMEGLATPHGTEKLLGEFRKDVEEEELGHSSEWYNDDEQFAKALQGMLEAKRQYGQGGKRRTQALARLTQEEVERCGFEPKAYAPEVAEAVTKLEHPDVAVRRAALTTLRRRWPKTLPQHITALVAKLEDKDAGVRKEVVEALTSVEPATLAKHSADLNPRLDAMRYDEDEGVRRAVVALLGKLTGQQPTLAQHIRTGQFTGGRPQLRGRYVAGDYPPL